MYYAKIIVKNNYEKRGDLVLRSYIRALKKAKANLMLNGDNAFIYGVVDENGMFHELFTNEVIDYNNYVYVSVEELYDATDTTEEKRELLNKIMNKVLFDKNVNLDFEISNMEELAYDRAVEFDAYDKFLSRINPYTRLTEENSKLSNAYNDFLYKVEQLKIMKKLDECKRDIDLYKVYDYEERPNNESDEKEYLVFEIPKKLIRK